ncbi:TonB-dependent receptor domain-containing protein [Hydrotalea sp.]|uniref:TonB-dependent receptor n=1 Tax=Hydrotalea sp. TaxID=2881279 RepID=UPI003D1238F8
MQPNLVKKVLLLLVLHIFCIGLAMAGEIKGKVFDATTGEPLIGATVTLEKGEQKFTTAVNLDGSFAFRKMPVGKYELKIKYVGYESVKEVKINLKNERDIATYTFNLNQKNTNLKEVVVVSGAGHNTDKYTRSLEKNADYVQNILSEKTIELLPDVTVANALQRVSGVTIQRNSSGEGRYAIIRGIDQRYNNVLVNGIKIPSPDDKYRFVPMDIFPSDMLERLEVIKTLTPNMEGDAIGGTLNLVMKNAPNHFLLNVNSAVGYSTLFSNRPFSAFDHSGINLKSPAEIYGNNYAATQNDFPRSNIEYHDKNNPINGTLGLTVGNRFLNQRLGIVFAASYQNFYRGSNSDFFIPNAQPDPGNVPVFTDILLRRYSVQTNRIGLHNKIDYVFNNRNKISLYNLYVNQNEYQTRYTVDSVLAIQRTGPGSGNVSIYNRSRWQKQSIYNATLQGDHTINDQLKLNWSAVYSIAKQALPDMTEYKVDHAVTTDLNSGVVTVSPSITQTMESIWQRNSDQDLAGYLNATYNKHIIKDIEFAFGGLYRYKTRDNYYNDYILNPVLVNGAPQIFTDIASANYNFKIPDNAKGINSALTPNNYTAHEKIGAGYLQAKFNPIEKLQVLGGVRVENTQQDYTTVMPATFNAKQGTIKYTDVLPSIHFKYALSAKENLRLSYFKSISRPGFYEITPYLIPGEYFNEIGNPYLKHVRADNLDLRYELFPGGADQFLVGAFYKELQNPIENFVVRNGGPSAQFIQPQNTNKATNYGIELVYTKYIGMFGISANYTYTHSQVTTDKNYYYRDPSTGQISTKLVSQTRPLQGQADNIGNLSLLYKNPKIGLDVQLAYVYTGERIAQVSPYANLDYWQQPYSQLDFSIEQRIIKRFSFYAKVNNLTNAIPKVYIKQPNNYIKGNNALPDQDNSNKILVQKDMYYMSFLTGLRFKF